MIGPDASDGQIERQIAGRSPPMIAPRPSASASAAWPRDRPWRTDASGSMACVASTYHASSGPDPSARPVAPSASARANIGASWANAARSIETVVATAAATRTVRRPITSARPPVGSSRAMVTTP